MTAALRETIDAGRQRSDSLNMRIDPKLKFLAELAAKELDITLSKFVERAIRRALTPSAMGEDEPNVLDPNGPRVKPPLWNEGLWDKDEVNRFFYRASLRPDLLDEKEQRLWKFYTLHMAHTGEQISLPSFQAFWNNPAINTSHLSEGEGE